MDHRNEDYSSHCCSRFPDSDLANQWACVPRDGNHIGVNIVNPKIGSTLEAGKSFTFTLEVNVDYEVEIVEVTLWGNMRDGWSHTWEFSDPSWSQTFTFSKTIELPADASPYDNYHLTAIASSSLGDGGRRDNVMVNTVVAQ